MQGRSACARFHSCDGDVDQSSRSLGTRAKSGPSSTLPSMLDDRAGLAPDERRFLEEAIAMHGTLQDVVRWAGRQDPPLGIVEVLVQDEFTHDVVLSWRDGRHLVYATT